MNEHNISAEQLRARRTIEKIRTQARMIYAMAEPGDEDTRIPALREAAETYRAATLAFTSAYPDDTPQRARELARIHQEHGALRYETGEETIALQLYRAALTEFRIATQDGIDGDLMAGMLKSYRALAVAAAVTKRTEEARLATGTGSAHARLACAEWPGIAVFEMERAAFGELEAMLGGNCPVFISDDPGGWIFED